mmetsp:Transcript_64556/g.102721  ORF Transcript_64556/g.102721 Transcript_64556/m.102721 type:complete len:211 (-) Transcript_64556:70-702(-)
MRSVAASPFGGFFFLAVLESLPLFFLFLLLLLLVLEVLVEEKDLGVFLLLLVEEEEAEFVEEVFDDEDVRAFFAGGSCKFASVDVRFLPFFLWLVTSSTSSVLSASWLWGGMTMAAAPTSSSVDVSRLTTAGLADFVELFRRGFFLLAEEALRFERRRGDSPSSSSSDNVFLLLLDFRRALRFGFGFGLDCNSMSGSYSSSSSPPLLPGE